MSHARFQSVRFFRLALHGKGVYFSKIRKIELLLINRAMIQETCTQFIICNIQSKSYLKMRILICFCFFFAVKVLVLRTEKPRHSDKDPERSGWTISFAQGPRRL